MRHPLPVHAVAIFLPLGYPLGSQRKEQEMTTRACPDWIGIVPNGSVLFLAPSGIA
jgi:hypothetical protein